MPDREAKEVGAATVAPISEPSRQDELDGPRLVRVVRGPRPGAILWCRSSYPIYCSRSTGGYRRRPKPEARPEDTQARKSQGIFLQAKASSALSIPNG